MAEKLSRRDMQAAQTHQDIVSAARRLFARQGYTRTALSQIAEAAGVSVQTIYDSVGSKRAIVQELNDLIDAEAEIPSLAARLWASQNPRETISLAVTISRNVNERCSDIMTAVLSASDAEPEMAAVYTESLRRHREGIRRTVTRLSEMGALRKDLTIEQSADVLAAMTWVLPVRTFVIDLGWSFDRWQEWAEDILQELLLTPPVK